MILQNLQQALTGRYPTLFSDPTFKPPRFLKTCMTLRKLGLLQLNYFTHGLYLIAYWSDVTTHAVSNFQVGYSKLSRINDYRINRIVILTKRVNQE